VRPARDGTYDAEPRSDEQFDGMCMLRHHRKGCVVLVVPGVDILIDCAVSMSQEVGSGTSIPGVIRINQIFQIYIFRSPLY